MMETELLDELVRGVKDVFSTMVMMEIESLPPLPPSAEIHDASLTSMLGLGGGIKGLLAIHCPKEVATGITGSFLGMEVAELDEDVKDAIGEIANMAAGCLKEFFAGKGIDIKLAIPSSVIGSSFRISGLIGSARLVVPFETGYGLFLVEFRHVLTPSNNLSERH